MRSLLDAVPTIPQWLWNSATQLPDDLDAPSWWSKPDATVRRPSTNPRLRDSTLGASLTALKYVKPAVGEEIGIPKHVGASGREGTSGALVYDVQPGGLAHAAGFQTGDVIVNVGRNRVQGLEDLKDALDQYRTGSRVHFTVQRWYFQEDWRKGGLDGRLGA